MAVMRHSSIHACEDVYAPLSVRRSEAQISNNLFYDLTSTGTVAASFGESEGLESWVYNNVFYEVGDSDYSVQVAADVDFYNNIIVATTRYGVTNSSADTGYNIGYGSSILDFFGTESATNFSDDPQFVDAARGDFTLDAGFSPAVDAGNPLSGYDDVDGTINDVGAFGGPFGAWTP